MFIKKIATLVLAFFIFSLTPFFPITKAHAYSNPAYSSEVKIGLEHMAAPVLVAKTNGEYYLNGNLIPSGTTLNFSITNGKVNVNGIEYSTITISPKIYGSLFALTSGTETNNYLGTFIFKIDNGRVYPINSLPLEDYLKGVVGYEMSDSYPAEALKSQAVAARTFALSNEGTFIQTKGFDFDDTPNYQVYYGYNPALKNVIKSISDTIGQVVTYNNTLIDALFSASHGGYEEDMRNVWGYSDPYLISKPDIYNGQTIDNADWTQGPKAYNNADIQGKLIAKGYLSSTDTFIKLDLNSITRYPSGRVSNINVIYNDVNGVQQIKYITADKCRTFLSLQSSLWNVTFDGITYTFTGKGFGHGLGMSQIGAMQRSLLGQTYDQILKFYYDNTNIAYLYQTPTISSYSAKANQVSIGQPIVLNANGQNGSGRYQYKFAVIKDGNFISDSGFSTNSSFNYTPSESGTYQFVLYLKDVESVAAYDSSQSLSVSVLAAPVITSSSLSKNQIFVGQSTNVNLKANGGSGNYLYSYTVTKDGSTVATRDFSSDVNFSFNPGASGNYVINAYLKDVISAKTYDDFNSMNLTVLNYASIGNFTESSQQLLPGQSINFTGAGNDGTGSYLYKYVVMNNGNVAASKDFDVNSSFSFTPNTPGVYTTSLYVKDVQSDKIYDSKQDKSFTVYQSPSITNFTVDSANSLVGQALNFSAQSQGGSGDVTYKFVVLKDWNFITETQFSYNTKYSYIPTQAGNYQVYVYIKDKLDTNQNSGLKRLILNVYAVPQITGTTVTGYMYAGKPVSLNSSYTVGSPLGSNIKYEIYKNGLLYMTRDFSSDKTYTFTPASGGTYTVKVYVKDIVSKNPSDGMKSFNLNIQSIPLTISTIPLYYGMNSQDVASVQAALIKLGYSISSATGFYGSQTQAAVNAFQRNKALTQTGTVDIATLNSINESLILKAGIQNINY